MYMQSGVNTLVIGRGYTMNKWGSPAGAQPAYFNKLTTPHIFNHFPATIPQAAFPNVYSFVDQYKETVLMKVGTYEYMSGIKQMARPADITTPSGWSIIAPNSGNENKFVAAEDLKGFRRINISVEPYFNNLFLYAYRTDNVLEYLGFMPVNFSAPMQVGETTFISPYDNQAMYDGYNFMYYFCNTEYYNRISSSFENLYTNYNNPDKNRFDYYVTASNSYAAYNDIQVSPASLTAEMFEAMTELPCIGLI